MIDRLCSACSLSNEQARKIAAYHEMLLSANRDMNLTRVPEDENEAVDRNYIDSLTLLKHISAAASVIDVGSGAGLPGIPLSIALPETRFTLLDSQKKRVEFLKSVIDALHLNAEAAHGRAEDFARKPQYRDAFDFAVARAVAETRELCELMLPFVKTGGYMLALKGPAAKDEVESAQNAITELKGELSGVYDAVIPDRDWRHTVIKILKIAPTPERYPRRAGVIEKRPL